MSVTNDPKHYREISKPFRDAEAVNEAIAAFFAEVSAAREKHRIADVIVIAESSFEIEGEEVRGSASMTLGDAARVIGSLAREYGAEQARHEERLALCIARARKAAKR